MGLGDLFKRLRGQNAAATNEASASLKFSSTQKGRKSLPPLPEYLKKDSFVHDSDKIAVAADALEAGVEAMADVGSFKRPGVWLKNKIGGVLDSQAIDYKEKSRQLLKRDVVAMDQDLRSFLEVFLEDAPEEQADKTEVSTKE